MSTPGTVVQPPSLGGAPPASPTVLTDQQHLERFVRYIAGEKGLAQNTINAYTGNLRCFLSFLHGQGLTMPQITRDVLVDFLYLKRGTPGVHYSMANSTRQLCRFLAREGVLEKNPAADMSLPKRPLRLPGFFKLEEIDHVLETIPATGFTNRCTRAMIAVQYAGALRISELVGLDEGHVDSVVRRARVLGKGNKEGYVPLTWKSLQLLEAYLQLKRALFPQARAVFVNVFGRRVSQDAYRKALQKWARRAGVVRRVYPHMLRHSCATHLLNSGMDIRLIQALLRHADLSSTQIYTHVDQRRLSHLYNRHHPHARAGRRQAA